MSNSSTLWSDAIYRLTRNKAAMFGAFILLILIASAALAPWIAPYSYSFQNLELGAICPKQAFINRATIRYFFINDFKKN